MLRAATRIREEVYGPLAQRHELTEAVTIGVVRVVDPYAREPELGEIVQVPALEAGQAAVAVEESASATPWDPRTPSA